jgi:hypothetical protein
LENRAVTRVWSVSAWITMDLKSLTEIPMWSWVGTSKVVKSAVSRDMDVWRGVLSTSMGRRMG